MPSGRYDRLIQFQAPALVDGGLARRKGDWTDLGPAVPARMKPGVGKERFANEQNAATAPAVYWFLWCPELDALAPDARLVDGAAIYEVNAVRWDGNRNSEVEVSAIRKRPA